MNKVNQNNIVELTEGLQTLHHEMPAQIQALSFPLNVLVIGSNAELQMTLETMLGGITNLHINFGAVIPEHLNQYNVFILVVDSDSRETKADIENLANIGINIILLGDDIDGELVRTAIHHNVKDILSMVEVKQELIPTLRKCAEDIVSQCNIAPVFTIMNGKSGSGASFITSCLGEISASLCSREIALIDADLNYGSLADSLNLEASYFLNNALEEIDKLDNVAIRSMMTKRDNLSLLASKPYSQLDPNDIDYYARLERLLWKVKLNHDLVLIDLSRGLESHTLPLLASSTNILLVLQQNINSLRETKALLQQLTQCMGISSESIHVIVNRYSPKVTNITLDDITKVLGINNIFCVGNNYQLASACSDCGSPILKLSDNKVIRKDICHIINELFPIDITPPKTGLINRIFRSS